MAEVFLENIGPSPRVSVAKDRLLEQPGEG